MRDNYTCQHCFKRGCYLEPHHIVPQVECLKIGWEEGIFDIDNGLSLCGDCHNLTKNGRGRG